MSGSHTDKMYIIQLEEEIAHLKALLGDASECTNELLAEVEQLRTEVKHTPCAVEAGVRLGAHRAMTMIQAYLRAEAKKHREEVRGGIAALLEDYANDIEHVSTITPTRVTLAQLAIKAVRLAEDS